MALLSHVEACTSSCVPYKGSPDPIMSPTRFKYFITLIDDFSRVTWFYLMKSQSQLFSHFSSFSTEIQTQFHVSLQTLRNDNAKEKISEPFYQHDQKIVKFC